MRIISGGEFGVQLGVLHGVKLYNTEFNDSGVSTFGYAAKGWRTDQGTQEKLLKAYGLWEDHPTPGFSRNKSRDIRNIDEADVVVVVSRNPTNLHLAAAWYALHGVYNPDNALSIDRDFEVVSHALKKVIFVQKLTSETLRTIAARLASEIGNISNVAFLGDSEERNSGIQELTGELIYTTLKIMYGKTER